MRSSAPSFERPPLGVKVIGGYSLLVGLATLVLTLAGSPLYLGISVLAFATALGLWRVQSWGVGAGILLYLLEMGRNTQSVLSGEMSSVIPAVLSLIVVVYLTQQRHYFR